MKTKPSPLHSVSSFLTAAVVCLGSSALGNDFTWNSDLGGSYSGSWTDTSADGWNGGPPASGDTALIDNGTVTATTNNQQAGVALTIGSAGVLNDGGEYLNFSGGSLTLDSGTIEVSAPSSGIYHSAGLGATITANSGDSFIKNSGAGDGLALEDGGSTFTGAGNLNLELGLFDHWNGASGVTKSGAGTLTFTGNSSYTGATTVNDGVLSLANGIIYSNAGWPDKQITINGGATVEVGGWGDLATAGLGQVSFTSYNILVNGGTIRYTGGYDGGNLDRGFKIGANGATLDAAGGANTFILDNIGRANTGITSDDGGTLTLTGSSDGVQKNVLGGTGGLVKSGAGTWSLTGINTYNGDTTVNGGSLAVNGTSLPDGTKLTIDGGSVVLTGEETVDTLFFGLVQQGAGTYSANGTQLTGSGTLVVMNGPAAGYASWMAPFITGGLTGDTTPGGDPENDGMTNLLEYALNGNPSISDPSIQPDPVVTATDFEFTYSRLDLSLADTTQTFEYGSNLTGWTPVIIPAGPGVEIPVGAAKVTIIDTGTTDSVTISIPKSVDPGGKLFGRLKVVK